MLRKKIVLLLLVTAVILAGCNNGEDTPTPTPVGGGDEPIGSPGPDIMVTTLEPITIVDWPYCCSRRKSVRWLPVVACLPPGPARQTSRPGQPHLGMETRLGWGLLFRLLARAPIDIVARTCPPLGVHAGSRSQSRSVGHAFLRRCSAAPVDQQRQNRLVAFGPRSG